jgi:hypothetical protein
MGTALKSASVAFLAAAEGTEQSELQHPWDAVIAQGGRPVLVSPSPDKIQMFEHLDRGATMPVDVQVGTSRRPQDLPAFCDTLTRVFGEATGSPGSSRKRPAEGPRWPAG